MKRYKFRLEQVLKVRKTQEDLAKAELAKANRAVTAAEAVLEARAAHYASVPRMTHQQPTAAFLGERFRHDAAAAAVMAARASRAAANACAAEQRMVWSERAREVQILVRLDDRRRAEHALEAAREADREADDMVVGRHGRNQP